MPNSTAYKLTIETPFDSNEFLHLGCRRRLWRLFWGHCSNLLHKKNPWAGTLVVTKMSNLIQSTFLQEGVMVITIGLLYSKNVVFFSSKSLLHLTDIVQNLIGRFRSLTSIDSYQVLLALYTKDCQRCRQCLWVINGEIKGLFKGLDVGWYKPWRVSFNSMNRLSGPPAINTSLYLFCFHSEDTDNIHTCDC